VRGSLAGDHAAAAADRRVFKGPAVGLLEEVESALRERMQLRACCVRHRRRVQMVGCGMGLSGFTPWTAPYVADSEPDDFLHTTSYINGFVRRRLARNGRHQSPPNLKNTGGSIWI
jgi:hypothetical protein